MMRYLRYTVLVLLALILFTLAMANRDPVVLRFLPANMAEAIGGSWAVELPLFLVILGGAVLGILVGFIWEWIREHQHRKLARQKGREAARLEKEVTALRKDARPAGEDDVLALLEGDRAVR